MKFIFNLIRLAATLPEPLKRRRPMQVRLYVSLNCPDEHHSLEGAGTGLRVRAS